MPTQALTSHRQGVTNDGRDNAIYVKYLHQVEEILTRYGTIDAFGGTTVVQIAGVKTAGQDLIAMVRKHQPQIIMNDRASARVLTKIISEHGIHLAAISPHPTTYQIRGLLVSIGKPV